MMVVQKNISPDFHFCDMNNHLQIVQKEIHWEMNGNSGLSSTSKKLDTAEMQPMYFSHKGLKWLQITPDQIYRNAQYQRTRFLVQIAIP